MTAPVHYLIRHVTTYQYHAAVAICHNQLRMLPRSFLHVPEFCSEVSIDPVPSWQARHVDYYGNDVLTFAIEAPHRRLQVRVASDVAVSEPVLPPNPCVAWQQVKIELATAATPLTLAAREFVFPSPLVPVREEFARYAQHSFDKHQDFVLAVTDLTQRIHTDFRYDSRATNIDTDAVAAYELRAGVCQDFAHFQIGCLRSLGLAARYVSGYLRTIPQPGKERLIGADESHAWVSVFAGEALGWIHFDPTNACLVQTDHIPFCIGRDYRDVSPMRGVALGGGQTSLTVSVDVAVRDSPPKSA